MIKVIGDEKQHVKQIRSLATKYKKLIPHWCTSLLIEVVHFDYEGKLATISTEPEYHRAFIKIYPSFFMTDMDRNYLHEIMHMYIAGLDTLMNGKVDAELQRYFLEECVDSLAIMVQKWV